MTTSVSKRQQARNERALHGLVKSIPGNNACAECNAANPGWASWSNMKKVGNIANNKLYNPQGKQPPVPVDEYEADSAMERFIRAKYVTRSLNGTNKYSTGASLSDNETPPPLPPKTGKFSLRSASSLFPLSSKAKKQAATEDRPGPRDLTRSPSPHLPNKASKVFGATIGASIDYDSGDTENKLARLRDMGFMDHARNVTILKGVNGNFERAVETLIRLGEGNSRSPSLVSPRESSLRATRSLTPLSAPLSTRPATSNDTPIASSASSTNPFDMLTPQPQTAQSTGTIQNKNPYLPSTNPFGAPGAAQADAFAQAFHNMSLAPPQHQPQPLFPNHTGGIPGQQAQSAYHQTSVHTPPVPQLPLGAGQTYPLPPQQMQSQNGYAPASPQSTPGLGYNPFFSDQTQQQQQYQQQLQQQQLLQQQQQQQQQPLMLNTQTQPYGNNPYTRSPTRIQSPSLGQIPEQSQYLTASPAAVAPLNNPFYTPPPPQQGFQPSQQSNKASILALYNYPLATHQPQPAQEQQQQQQQPTTATTVPNPAVVNMQQPRSVSTPLPGGSNPFYAANGATAPAEAPHSTNPFGKGIGHSSRDSVALGLDMASWSKSGRHSPDAFASLSARHG
ncbi:related to GTS1 - transcription factor of the Gcs1p/Glo3p/Sps18p family [Cephalotrichum gorgonifer]|uniref:Related to GTS1 - transcription factor of the Gcs1p/Glo3p/Sps18p family n=1 Tax=Cephalotrichum gorgonifer TaxID=2041049 RepID=A0AAE8MQP1_9PEZI|nr:related to GTS1 - transcription factor of the Gcs1p/Glo3p/Sps18p family [Cephalotrichum gorgonifer]